MKAEDAVAMIEAKLNDFRPWNGHRWSLSKSQSKRPLKTMKKMILTMMMPIGMKHVLKIHLRN
jgi:hypothetical protein